MRKVVKFLRLLRYVVGCSLFDCLCVFGYGLRSCYILLICREVSIDIMVESGFDEVY